MTWFIVGVSIVVGVLLMVRWFVTADPRAVIWMMRWTVAGLAVAFSVFMLFTGRLAWAWVALMAILPWIARLRILSNLAKVIRGRTPGQRSEVRTRFVHMALSHDTGEMDGEVQIGPYEGRRLSQLTLVELVDLHRSAVLEDQQSASVLEAYLDRLHGDVWRESAESFAGEAGTGSGHMTVSEAREILGVDADADEDEIKKAHRSLMQKHHPDKGGSDQLAARINEAKDILLEVYG
jgi:hypothetical protein